MPEQTGYVLVLDEQDRADWLRESHSWKGSFSDALSARDWEFKDYEVCLISFGGGAIDVACLGQRGKIVASAKYRVSFSLFVALDALPFNAIGEKIGAALRPHLVRSSSGRGGRVPPETWREAFAEIKRQRPAAAEALDNLVLLKAASKRVFAGAGVEVVALERDAVGVALDIFDQSKQLRKDTLTRWAPPSDALDALPPFLDGVNAIRLTEEQMLSHDANIFPGDGGVSTRFGRRFTLANRVLDVAYLNRTTVEKTLGVDLVYYNHTFAAYTLVQYKRMVKERLRDDRPESSVFRPSSDGNFQPELVRMRDFRSRLPDGWGGQRDWAAYRLDGDGFFFKFCPSITLEVLSGELIKGLYLPREYMESLLNSTITNGPQGGKLISYENVQRHLSNTDFTSLVQHGWIGTRGLSTLEVTDVIRRSLEAGRAVVFARSEEVDELEADEAS